MRIPTIKGIIKRRLLVNFRADPEVVGKLLPIGFRPKLQGGFAMVGICLIRLEKIRPAFFPLSFGVSSENAAHRMAVCWTDDGGAEKEGVFIVRRDTSSLFNHLTGGRVFPGEHARAHFVVSSGGGKIDFRMESVDGKSKVFVNGQKASALPTHSCFKDLSEASGFFKAGSTGYSVTRNPSRLDGLVLKTRTWAVSALDVSEVSSSYYNDQVRFPEGSIHFDNALMMEDIEHEWHGTRDMIVKVDNK